MPRAAGATAMPRKAAAAERAERAAQVEAAAKAKAEAEMKAAEAAAPPKRKSKSDPASVTPLERLSETSKRAHKAVHRLGHNDGWHDSAPSREAKRARGTLQIFGKGKGQASRATTEQDDECGSGAATQARTPPVGAAEALFGSGLLDAASHVHCLLGRILATTHDAALAEYKRDWPFGEFTPSSVVRLDEFLRLKDKAKAEAKVIWFGHGLLTEVAALAMAGSARRVSIDVYEVNASAVAVAHLLLTALDASGDSMSKTRELNGWKINFRGDMSSYQRLTARGRDLVFSTIPYQRGLHERMRQLAYNAFAPLCMLSRAWSSSATSEAGWGVAQPVLDKRSIPVRYVGGGDLHLLMGCLSVNET